MFFKTLMEFFSQQRARLLRIKLKKIEKLKNVNLMKLVARLKL